MNAFTDEGLPVVDATHGKADATYDIHGLCLTCGQRFVVRRLRGIDPPLSVRCPGACGTSLFGWRAARASPATAPEGLDAMRYARAFYEVTKRRIPLLPSWEAISADHMETIRKDAAEVAAEYARLGESS